MKIPYEWLCEFLDINSCAADVAQKLAMSGTEVSSVEDGAISVEILPNRGDCQSIIGIAREVCATFNLNLKSVEVKLTEDGNDINDLASVEVNAPDLCPRYMARVIEGVEIKDSPDWMRKRLNDAGMRPINNIVDITNYVLLELGQPLHAFDLDKIEGKKIVVRRAGKGEKLVTLDTVEHILAEDDLLIADTKRGVALAGVMGGSNSEVTSSTRNILLESAYFDPATINKTSKNQKVRSEASARFEKGVDFDNVAIALDRAAALMAEHAAGHVARGVIDVKAHSRKNRTITLRLSRIKQILGVEIPRQNAFLILTGLQFGVTDKGETFEVSIPAHRDGDIEREIDLIEEIIRIWGYDKLETTYPNIKNLEVTGDASKRITKEDKVREIFLASGFCEGKTYSLIGEKLYKRAGLGIEKAPVISNPLISEMTNLRTSLIPGLLSSIEHNVNRQMTDVALFEIGKVFSLRDGKVIEKNIASAVITGSVYDGTVDSDRIKEDTFFVKGVFENILDEYGIVDAVFKPSADALLPDGAEVFLNEKKIGFFGKLQTHTQSEFGSLKPVYVLEINLDILDCISIPKNIFVQLPKYPSVRRDIAMFVEAGTSNADIIGEIKNIGGELVENAFIFDKFSGKGKTSLAYAVIYRDKAKTMTDDEVNNVHEKAVTALIAKFGVEIRK